MNSEVEDCLIRLENQMYGFGGVAGRSASGDRYSVEEHIRDIEGYERDARRDVLKKDTRIAELTDEVERYKSACMQIDNHHCECGNVTTYNAHFYADIARNALKDGV